MHRPHGIDAVDRIACWRGAACSSRICSHGGGSRVRRSRSNRASKPTGWMWCGSNRHGRLHRCRLRTFRRSRLRPQRPACRMKRRSSRRGSVHIDTGDRSCRRSRSRAVAVGGVHRPGTRMGAATASPRRRFRAQSAHPPDCAARRAAPRQVRHARTGHAGERRRQHRQTAQRPRLHDRSAARASATTSPISPPAGRANCSTRNCGAIASSAAESFRSDSRCLRRPQLL